MKRISSEIEISASPDRVWQVLTDFSAFPDWNPFVRSAEGELKVGEQLQVYLKRPNGKGMTFKPKILRVEPNREFRWLGRLLMPGLFDGEHIWTIEPTEGDRVRLTQEEHFTGVLVSLMSLMGALSKTLAGFHQMNQALKDRAEQPAAQ